MTKPSEVFVGVPNNRFIFVYNDDKSNTESTTDATVNNFVMEPPILDTNDLNCPNFDTAISHCWMGVNNHEWSYESTSTH